MRLDELIDEAFKLKNISCPKGRVNYPCVFCLECKEANYQEFNGNNIVLKKTVNSSLVELKIPIRDDLDVFFLKKFVKELASIKNYIMPNLSDDNRVVIFVKYEDTKDPIKLREIRDFIIKFPVEIPALLTKGRSFINDWISREVKKLLGIILK